MQIIKYVCLNQLKHHWDSSLLLGPTLTLSQTELKKESNFLSAPIKWFMFSRCCSKLSCPASVEKRTSEVQQWDAGSVCPGLSSNRNKPADGSKVATPRSFHRTLSRRRTREHALHHLTLNFSQTFRAEASSQQAEVHLQAPPTLTSRLVWQHRCDINDDGKRCLLL